MIQYRALGFVTVASLVIAGAVTYGSITYLSGLIGYRLSLAGVAGIIVSIGVTADSFIVYFERVRDELTRRENSARLRRARVEPRPPHHPGLGLGELPRRDGAVPDRRR